MTDIARIISDRIRAIQTMYVNGSSTGRMLVARLSHAVALPPGGDPTATRWALDGIPAGPDPHDASDMQRAAWTAVTQYAVCQHGVHHKRMHVDGVTPGRAFNRLIRMDDNMRPLVDRLLAARDQREAIVRLTPVIRMLHQHLIGMDWGLLAADLTMLADPARIRAVRLAWRNPDAGTPTDIKGENN